MDSKTGIVDCYRDRKRAVQEVVTRKCAHEEQIQKLQMQLLQPRRSGSADAALEARADAFFSTSPDNNQHIATLQSEFNRLNSELPLFDVMIERRKRAVDELQGEYNDFVWAPLKPRDDDLKLRMANSLVELSKCCQAEEALLDEIVQADARPPAAYRRMQPNFIGRLDDPNSFVSMWLRELGTYYPHLKIKKESE